MHRFGPALALALAALATAGCATGGAAERRAAEAARREPVLVAPAVMFVSVGITGRATIPARSEVRVQLRAATDSTLVVGDVRIPATGARPYQLRIPIEPTLLDPARSYAVHATISRPDGRVIYRSARQTAFLAGFLPDGVELMVAAPAR